MDAKYEPTTQTSAGADDQAVEPRKMSRREALAIVGKHAVYTAPAVLAILAVTKSGDAGATDPCPASKLC